MKLWNKILLQRIQLFVKKLSKKVENSRSYFNSAVANKHGFHENMSVVNFTNN